jgi:lathosterol oxidase
MGHTPFSWTNVAISTAALTLIIALRYVGIAWAAHVLIWRKDGRVAGRRLNRDAPRAAVMRHELKLSVLSSWIYALPAAFALEVFKAGGTKMYLDVGRYGVWWLIASAAIYLIVQDSWYYWLHRAMHHPWLFRWTHAGHHRSRQPTAFASFSFDWSEAALNAWLLPAMVFVIPVHPFVVLTILMVATLVAVLNHSGAEVLPPWVVKGPIGWAVISATHHSVHHTHYNTNYGLYFRFWDRIMGTDRMPAEAPAAAATEGAGG